MDIFSELIVSAIRQINVAQSKSNDVHDNPGYEYDSGRVYSICMVIRAALELTSWPSG